MANNNSSKALKYLLTPISWIYGMVTSVRNWMFDHNILPQEEFKVPIVSIGNLTVGGTGKTPHTEYIVGLLAMDYNIAILSRGYKRKTKGFLVANSNSTPDSIGDEPLQMYQKLGAKVKVAVCENRRKGIKELLKQFPEISLIVLDDAFQHRYVLPKVSILLMDYNRPIYEDKILPLGRLRESAHQVNRADMVIVTKCPANLNPLDFRLVSNNLDLMKFQKLYFSKYVYGGVMPVFPDDNPLDIDINELCASDTAMLITGIANPRGFVRHFKSFTFKKNVYHFSDHHDFTRDDIEKIERKFNSLSGRKKLILTTEKDAVRLAYNPYYPSKLKKITYYIPIAVNMVQAWDSDKFISDLKKEINA